MKLLLSLLVCWCFGVASAAAQVTVELVSEATNFRVTESTRLGQFLPNESMWVAVKVYNHSGQTLELGKETDWLTFSIEAADKFVVKQLADVPVVSPFKLDTSEVGTRTLDIAPYFDLSRPGRYRITAIVKIAQWNDERRSFPKYFDIVSGSVIWEQELGVPPAPGSNGEPETRKYSLVQARLLDDLRLYLRVTDTYASKVFAVTPIGPMTSQSTPEVQVDKRNNIHVLYKYGARAFNYSVFNPDGKLVLRQTHDYTATRPHLTLDQAGLIFVTGGVHRIAASDFPAAPKDPVPDTPIAPPPLTPEKK